MIAVDSSAFLAIVLREREEPRCVAALEAADERIISAATLTETFIVGLRRGVLDDLRKLIDSYSCQVVPVELASALRIAQIYRRFGKGFHTAALNFGDCFAYDVAREHNCPLLYIGNDFALTDIASALDIAPE